MEILLQQCLHESVQILPLKWPFLSRASNVGSRILLRKLWQNLHGVDEYYLGEYSWRGTVPLKEIGITSDLAHFADQNLHGSSAPFKTLSGPVVNGVFILNKKPLLYQDNIDAETNEVSKWRQIWTFQKNSRYVQIANDGFSVEVVVVMCSLIKNNNNKTFGLWAVKICNWIWIFTVSERR